VWVPLRLVRPWFLLSVCVSAACEPLASHRGFASDKDVGTEEPLLVAYPSILDFGTVPVSSDLVVRTLTLENPGTVPVTVYGHDQPIGLYGEDIGVFTLDTEPILELAPGEVYAYAVMFSPQTDGRWEAALDLHPGEQVIEVVGRGSAPVLGVDEPTSAVATIGCEDSVAVDIYNQGSAPLTITDLDLDDPWDSWTLAADPVPAKVEPGERLRVRYSFSPEFDADSHGQRPASLTVHSDDPLTPSTTVALTGLAVQVDGVEERFIYSADSSVDLLVVADTDGVMGLRVPEVSAAMPTLVSNLVAVGASLQTAVVTGGSPCPETFPAFADPSYEILERAALLQAGLLGDAGLGSDRLGEHAAAALEQAGSGSCLDGFLRPDARLHVLLVAGDDDLSTLRSSTQLARIVARAPDASRVTVSTILPTDSYGCDGTIYSASYAELAAQTDGAVIDLCSDDLSAAMVQIADAAVADLDAAFEHALGRAPIPASIEVTVDGEPWPHFDYRAIDHTVVFDASRAPRAGAEVVIAYRAAEEC
jgi:hypothetical protein